MSDDRGDDAEADEDSGEGDGGDEKITGPTENRRERWLRESQRGNRWAREREPRWYHGKQDKKIEE